MNKAFGLRIFLMQRLFNLNFEKKTKFTKKGKKPDFEFNDIIVYFESSNIQHMGLM